jgi:hypothetical protein
MNILERFQGVFASPKKTLEGLAAKPVWVDALLILLILVAVYTYIITPIIQTETVAMFQTNTKLMERMGKDRFEQFLKSQTNTSPGRRLTNSLAISPLTAAAGFLISSLFLLIFGRIVSTSGTYKEVLSVFLHANFINIFLGNAVRLLIILAKKSVFQTTTSLAMLFPRLPFGSPGYIVLSQLDIFQLWMFGVLGYGLAAVFKVELKKALYVSYGFFVLKSIVYIALGFLSRSFMGQ